jgi:DNA-binding NarL/FixJ family response regulator
MISVVVIHSDEPQKIRIQCLLAPQPDMEITGMGNDGYDAVMLVNSLKPDAAILDSRLDRFEGVEISRLIKRNSPSTNIILLCSRADRRLAARVLRGEAAAYIAIQELDRLAGIIRQVHAGESYVNSRFAAELFPILVDLLRQKREQSRRAQARRNLPPDLSRTELRVLSSMAEGRSSQEIAGELGLSVGTVRNSISSAMRKTGLKNRAQMALWAAHWGLTRSHALRRLPGRS